MSKSADARLRISAIAHLRRVKRFLCATAQMRKYANAEVRSYAFERLRKNSRFPLTGHRPAPAAFSG
jgi:hypothetical protein